MADQSSFPLRRNPPFRAEHIGSLLRSETLLKKRADLDEGKASTADVKPIQDEDIEKIVQVQLDLGFHAVTNGEYNRHMFFDGFWEHLEGMKEIKNPDPQIFREYVPDIAAFTESGFKPASTVVCVGKIKHVSSGYVDEFKYLASLVPKDKVNDVKLTLAVPSWYHLRHKEGHAYPRDVYSSDDEYFNDIAKAFQAELSILHDAGCRNVQFDDPNLAYFCSEKMIAGWKADKSNPYSIETLLDKYIQTYNASIAAAPADMHIGLHLCRGNFVQSRHFSEGSYERIATQLFQKLNVHTYYLEYDTPRAGGFEPLMHLPKNKNAILGVITSKFPKMEDLDEMKGRVMQAAEWIQKGTGETKEEALNRMGVSPQCGFASHSHGNLVAEKDMIEKLKLVRRLADEIWPGQP